MHCKKSLAYERPVVYVVRRSNAVTDRAVCFLGRFLPKLGGAAKRRHFFLIRATSREEPLLPPGGNQQERRPLPLNCKLWLCRDLFLGRPPFHNIRYGKSGRSQQT